MLATAGNLVFLPDAAGIVHAYNAETGKELWSHNDGIGHAGGIISYAAGGKQFIAVPAGWGSLVGEGYGAMFGETVEVHADGCRGDDCLCAALQPLTNSSGYDVNRSGRSFPLRLFLTERTCQTIRRLLLAVGGMLGADNELRLGR